MHVNVQRMEVDNTILPMPSRLLRAAPIEERYFCSKQIIPLSIWFTHVDVWLIAKEQNVKRIISEICKLFFMGLGTLLPASFAKL